jgi:drug/metabolite transporter (DMT)-like permease
MWGASFVATKICLGFLSPVELMAFRFAIGLPILFILLIVTRVKLSFGENKLSLLLASLIILAHFFIQITGIKYTSATNTGWIISITPLVVMVMAILFLKEKIRIQMVLGILIATVGVIFLISQGKISDVSWLRSRGDWLVLLSAHTWALYTIVSRKISKTINPLLLTFVVLIPSAIVSIGYVSITSSWTHFAAFPSRVYFSLLFLGVIGTAISHWFWQRGVASLGAARAGIFLYLEPFATTAIAVPLLNEAFGLFTALGAVLVLSGVWLGQRSSNN